MLTFKEYLKESNIVTTKRKGLLHLEKMKPSEFLQFVRDIMRQHNGKLKDIKISLKVDGAGIRFGKDVFGNFFFETSNSGPIQHRNAFSSFAIQRGDKDLTRARHYDNMFNEIKSSSIWKDLPNDTKVIAEILYNPMAEILQDNKIKFVTVTYDKTKLGSLMTIIPLNVIKASTGEEHPKKDEIIENLLKKSNNVIKIESPKLKSGPLDVETVLKPILDLDSDIDKILTSRKAADKPKKELYQLIIQNVKEQLAKFILEHPGIIGKDKFGPEIEGLVLDIGDKQFKITTKAFKESKVKKR